MISSGQGDQITQLASDPNHPATQKMKSGFADNIMQKFGIGGDAAKGIAGSPIPMVMAKLSGGGNVADTPGGFNLGSLTSLLSKTGLDKDGDGDVDLKDVTKMFGL